MGRNNGQGRARKRTDQINQIQIKRQTPCIEKTAR